MKGMSVGVKSKFDTRSLIYLAKNIIKPIIGPKITLPIEEIIELLNENTFI